MPKIVPASEFWAFLAVDSQWRRSRQNPGQERGKSIMTCKELEKLEAQNAAIWTRARQLGLSDEERERLQSELVAMIFKIKDHEAFGHGGQPCPAE